MKCKLCGKETENECYVCGKNICNECATTKIVGDCCSFYNALFCKECAKEYD